MVWFWGDPVWNQELDSVILVGPFQCGTLWYFDNISVLASSDFGDLKVTFQIWQMLNAYKKYLLFWFNSWMYFAVNIHDAIENSINKNITILNLSIRCIKCNLVLAAYVGNSDIYFLILISSFFILFHLIWRILYLFSISPEKGGIHWFLPRFTHLD